MSDSVSEYMQYAREHLAKAEKYAKQGRIVQAAEQLEQLRIWADSAIRALPVERYVIRRGDPVVVKSGGAFRFKTTR